MADDCKALESRERNKRYAFEWFMREEDRRYWRQTKDLVLFLTKKATRQSMIFTVALWGMTIICFWLQLRKSEQQFYKRCLKQ